MSITVLIPAHNEAGSIADTIEALLIQDRTPNQIIVIPNGCTDSTAEIARQYPVSVYELPALKHRKAEALNMAWVKFCSTADIVICLDADTVLPPHAIGDWEKEMQEDSKLGGSSSKFTMLAPDFLSRLQKAEFATWTDTSLRRGETSVLAGTGCAIRNSALWSVVNEEKRFGPWSYESATEDFELTYQIRRRGFRCQVSPTVRAYTDSMRTVKALWGQRMKWQVGTIDDLLRFGFNRYTARDWAQQGMGIVASLTKILWILVMASLLILGVFHFVWLWWILPFLFIALELKRASRIPHRDKWDWMIAASFFPTEIFNWIRSGWFVWSWFTVGYRHITGRSRDLWAAQYDAERR